MADPTCQPRDDQREAQRVTPAGRAARGLRLGHPTLTNSGAIGGGKGGNGGATAGVGGAGGDGRSTIRATITTLTNSGTLSGGNGGAGHTAGGRRHGAREFRHDRDVHQYRDDTSGSAGADAIYSAGPTSIGLLSNSGQIDGAVDLLGGSGDTLDNFGLISGNIALAGGDTLMNQGQVYGDVTLAGGDTLIDAGSIHGDVTLGSADSFDASQGGVAGTIGASSGDLFEFGGHFGAETIDNFTAGAGPTHDTLEFSTSDFASYAALTHAMSQVGSNVMIRLDATDSIALNHVSLSSLVSADFKFG